MSQELFNEKMMPGERLTIVNTTSHALRYVCAHPDGTKFEFVVLIGGEFTLTAGRNGGLVITSYDVENPPPGLGLVGEKLD